jgi:hypothetical protein
MNNDYVEMITVGKHADDILRLPCVDGCHKELDGSITWHVNCANSGIAREGDLLCRRQNGVWKVEHSEEGGEL